MTKNIIETQLNERKIKIENTKLSIKHIELLIAYCLSNIDTYNNVTCSLWCIHEDLYIEYEYHLSEYDKLFILLML
ncbi:hypothetical protein A9Q91_03055 [Candidatus Gracilibacteria bacterium 28_42_T64]|nr:hypothetical protein A9Q91_03055 [Candidatus Gracilibacteria bacterium 28_42_T64]